MSGRVTRGFVRSGQHSQLVVLPDLAAAKRGMSAPQARTAAESFIRELKLEPQDNSRFVALPAESWRAQEGEKGRLGPIEERIQNVGYMRNLEGLETIGPSSELSVQVGDGGVSGVRAAIRRFAVVSGFKPRVKPLAAAERERDEQIRAMSQMVKGKPRILARHLVYIDQDMQYVQPAYVWGVEWTGPVGKAANLVTVAAFANTPEAIMPMPMKGDMTPPEEGRPRQIGGNDLLADIAPQANPVQIGMYVVRNDDSCWVSSAWSFWTNIQNGGGWPARNLLQYWWNHDYYWENVGSTSSLRRWVVGQVHVGLLEGHGAPWEITTLSNNADIIHLNSIAGFGAGMGGGEKTAYVIWHSCDVVPVPGDPHGGDFTSGTAWDVWWHLFRGLRGTYGYRTTMAICDGVTSGFGDSIGRGCANVSAWMSATNGAWWYRFWYGWDHGSAVIIGGHENDCIYDNTALPSPGTLTMWWN